MLKATSKGSVVKHFSLAAAFVIGMTGATIAQDQVTIVGAGPGAGAFQLAGALAEAVNRTEGIDVVVTNRASKGFVASTRMVETGGADFALTNGVFVYNAQNGIAPFEEMKAENIRGVRPVSTSWFHMTVPRSSGIESYTDLEGKPYF